MNLDKVRRRTLLSGITASFAGLAGCESSGSNRASSQSSNVQSNTSSIPEHDHSSAATGGTAINAETISVTRHQQSHSYLVYKRGEELRVLDGETEEEVFSGSDTSMTLQRAINEVGGDNSGGTIFIKSGVYEVGPYEIRLQSNVRLVGEGPGATILRLKDGINGERGVSRATVLRVGHGVENVSIQNLEIDGNESNNRDVPPYPKSPHSHGIQIHGRGSKVPEDQKPSNILVKDVYIHDTVRSNIVLAGRNCRLENLRLENSATDHWLYMAGATNCVIDGIHASGFARTEGIVLGTDGRRCSGNTISNVKISQITETPYQNDEPEGFMGRYPVLSFSLRPGEEELRHDNTIQDVDIVIPDAEAGQVFSVGHPNTKIQNLNYRGPNGKWGVLALSPDAEDTRVADASLYVSGNGRNQGHTIIEVNSSNTYLDDLVLEDDSLEDLTGILAVPVETPMTHLTIRDTSIATQDSALVLQGGENQIREVVADNVFDKNETGVETDGDVKFAQQNLY